MVGSKRNGDMTDNVSESFVREIGKTGMLITLCYAKKGGGGASWRHNSYYPKSRRALGQVQAQPDPH